MKVYPLIYSRTKNVDFVPDFLARPADINVKEALKYIENAIANLDMLKGIRYTTFTVGDYCICGGISCLTRVLVEQLRNTQWSSSLDLINIEEYLADCKGRSLASFIGFAVPKDEIRSGRIPDVNLCVYWDKYLEYLKHQWESEKTSSEKLTFPPIQLEEKTYSSRIIPKLESVKGKVIVKDYTERTQETLDYYFNRILNDKSTDSFISDITNIGEWNNLYFNNVSVSENLYQTLMQAQTIKSEDHFDSIMHPGHNSRDFTKAASNGNEHFGNLKNKSQTYNTSQETQSRKILSNRFENMQNERSKTQTYSSDRQNIGRETSSDNKENNIKKNKVFFPVAAILCVLILIVLLILKLK